MAIAYITPEMEQQFATAAAALGRSPEEIPTLAMTVLEWFIERRQEGFELMLGRRENPDDQSEVKLYRVPAFEVIQMDEQGVERRGLLDVVAPGSAWERAG